MEDRDWPHWWRKLCPISWMVGAAFHDRRINKENYAHLSTKHDLADRLDGLETLSIESNFSGNICAWSLDMRGLRPVVECGWPDGIAVPDAAAYYARNGRYPRRIFDVGLVNDRREVVGAFEVVYTHGLDARKTADFVDHGLFCIVVRALKTPLTGGAIEAVDVIVRRPGCDRLLLTRYDELPNREAAHV